MAVLVRRRFGAVRHRAVLRSGVPVRRMTARQAFFRSSPDVRCRNHSLKKLIRFLHSAGRKSGLQNAELSPGLNPFLRFVFWGRALYNTVSIINDGESLNVQCIRSVDCPMFGHDFSRRLPKRHVRMARESCRHRGFVFPTLDFHTSIDSTFGGERVAAQSRAPTPRATQADEQ